MYVQGYFRIGSDWDAAAGISLSRSDHIGGKTETRQPLRVFAARDRLDESLADAVVEQRRDPAGVGEDDARVAQDEAGRDRSGAEAVF
jgi:hypothetical protein